MIYPTREQYIRDAGSHNLIPVFAELRADFETPVSLFLKVEGNILLESVEQGENVGRFSIIGLGKRLTITLTGRKISIIHFNGGEAKEAENYHLDNPLEMIREIMKRFTTPDYPGLPPFYGGAIGYLGYETVRYFERIPVHEEGYDQIPDGMLMIPECVLVYDTVKRSVFIIVLTTPGPNPGESHARAVHLIQEASARIARPLPPPESRYGTANAEMTPSVPREAFLKAVERCKGHIAAGDIIQAVLSQKFSIGAPVPPFEIYRTLRIINPSPYLFYLNFGDFAMIGSSPEVMVRLQNGEILLKPIAGTRPRGKSVAEDAALAEELLADPKERAEHVMLVDLGRNDLGRVALPGTVKVSDFMKVEKYSHVMHIVSTIEARIDPRYDEYDLIRSCFPAGTLTGAPKIRAMEIIHDLEPERRGPYGGMIFNIGFNRTIDSCITIRTIVLKDGIATIQSGAGIVADSSPEAEFRESLDKARALFEAIRLTGAEGGLS